MNQVEGCKAGIVCCSNGLSADAGMALQQLRAVLENIGVIPVFSAYLFAADGVRAGTAKERAEALMECYRNPDIGVIFDISGGDIANELLPYLDYNRIAETGKQFWGYSDLTVVLNAVYARTGNEGVLYQVRNLKEQCNAGMLADFADAVLNDGGDGQKGRNRLFGFQYSFFQGEEMAGTVVGGNIRCFLKLAGTQYFPDLTEKVLFLEARSGGRPQMITYLSQLKQLGAFDKVCGVLLGTFTQLENEQADKVQKMERKDEIRNEWTNGIEALVKEFAGDELPIAKTFEIGHAKDSKAIRIGGHINLKKI